MAADFAGDFSVPLALRDRASAGKEVAEGGELGADMGESRCVRSGSLRCHKTIRGWQKVH